MQLWGGGGRLYLLCLPPSLGWLVLFVCLLLALPVQAKTRDIMMHPETGQSLLSLHTRLM